MSKVNRTAKASVAPARTPGKIPQNFTEEKEQLVRVCQVVLALDDEARKQVADFLATLAHLFEQFVHKLGAACMKEGQQRGDDGR